MMSGIYRPQEIRFNVRKMAEDRGGIFVRDRVSRLDPGERTLFLESGQNITYDVVSFNTGSQVPVAWDTQSGVELVTVKPIVNLLAVQRFVLDGIEGRALHLVVAVGGPAGVEMAGNLRRLVQEAGGQASLTLVGGAGILKKYPERVRKLVIRNFASREIQILEGERVVSSGGGLATLESGETLKCDLLLAGVGVRPSPIFRDSGLPVGDDGGLLINRFLQSVRHPEIFGGGDCVTLEGSPLARVGVYAVRQNPVLCHNLLAALEGGDLREFHPDGHYLLILNLGDGRGVAWRRGLGVFNGRLAFRLKDYIDRRFMRKFQVSGELREGTEEAP
jgi:NADH dehydrogenase FAD-containing subunit